MAENLLNREEFMSCEAKLPVIVGEDANSNLLINDLKDLQTLLLLGETGTPRVPYLQALIAGLIKKCSPEDLKLFLIDFSGAELAIFRDIPHAKCKIKEMNVSGPIGAYEECFRALESVLSEIMDRRDLICSAGVKDIKEYNSLAEEKLPYIVCVVEHAQIIKSQDIGIVQGLLAQISKTINGTGVCLVYCLNKLTSMSYATDNNGKNSCGVIEDPTESYSVLTKEMLDCFSAKVIFRVYEPIDVLMDYSTKDFERREYWFVAGTEKRKDLSMPLFFWEELKGVINLVV